MYRLEYANLDLKQVEEILSKRTAPISSSGFCGRLTGKSLKIVTDKLPVEGPTLEYEFKSDTKLLLKENGGAAVGCDYGALSLKDVTLFSHMVPGGKKGYTTIVNWKTSVVTVYEMWFIDYEGFKIDHYKTYYDIPDLEGLDPVVNREVQRQYYFGYLELPGKEPPTERDRLSLKMENAVIKWREDRGKHRLNTYTSTTFSTVVELDTPDGGDMLAFVSDILRINDSMFIYCFGEVEYSGRLSVEVLDLGGMKKIGVTMGIGEDDKFEHTLYSGKGELLGRFGTFYDFNDKGDQYSDFTKGPIDFSKKGTRATYRPRIMMKKITREELTEASKNTLIFSPERQAEKVMSSAHFMEASDYCAGKNLKFRGDNGYTVELRFKTGTELEYRMEGESEWHLEEYRATEIDDGLIILGYYRSGSNPPANHIFALDFVNGCATCIASKIGSKHDMHDVEPSYHFGVIEMEGLTPLRIFRHGFTDELLGHAYTRTYSDTMSSIHIYNAPHSYSWTIITHSEPGSPANRAGGPVWSSPCEYVKIRKDIYMMNWVEQKWAGLMGCMFMNHRTMHECGFTFGLLHDGKTVIMDQLGAISRPAGYVDLSGVYELTSYDTMS
jgi:hypothetical protein